LGLNSALSRSLRSLRPGVCGAESGPFPTPPLLARVNDRAADNRQRGP